MIDFLLTFLVFIVYIFNFAMTLILMLDTDFKISEIENYRKSKRNNNSIFEQSTDYD